jgi:hypothetical protein
MNVRGSIMVGYSMSASTRMLRGTVRPSALAVVRSTASSKSAGCSTGMSH